MEHNKRRIWLIPAAIIGFNCLAFLCILFISFNRKNNAPSEAAAASTEAAEEALTGETITEEAGETHDPEAGTVSLSDEDIRDLAGQDAEDDLLLQDQGSGYVLLLTSSESDLDIQIVDSDGQYASGMDWKASVGMLSEDGTSYEDEFEAYDEDRDGVIYLDEMTAGTYDVTVDNGSGIVESSTITVKPRIKYKESSGIRSIVMQEKDIDATVEDTGSTPEVKEEEAISEGEGTSATTAINLPQGSLGIDVSKYNKDIDWAKVKASGIEFAIIRAGYRGSSSGVLVEDPYFRQNLAGAKAAGVKIGVYFFTQAVTVDEAREEAEAVASLVNASDLEFPVFLDVESSGNANGGRADGLDTETRTEIVRTFCASCEELGYRAGVYANKTWMTKKLDMSRLAPYTKWLAQYRAGGPTYDGEYSIWQYTSSGAVDGITGRVDLDVFIQ
ncbi:MAG: glycoside hydrolase family 25 protein [Lachnospiraceae bacterium]|nr:glycoside hydrolase family 25 protein [Lachnospiraceae bacterium]